MNIQATIVCLIALTLSSIDGPRTGTQPPKPTPTTFSFPCTNYERGLQEGGNFGLHVDSKSSPFYGSWHLAEDVWLPASTEVVSIADGIVRYSAFSPTWTDADKHVHWNFGNVIVIEHTLEPPIEDLGAICSIYVHLAADRRVKVGDRVTRGQVIARIGADRSEENGRYPAHLHFGIHRGPYLQIPPAFERQIRLEAASKEGLRVGPDVLKGAVEIRMNGQDSVLVTSTETHASVLMSLLVGSTAPKDPPPDIMAWCEGYGAEATLSEWIRPSKFIALHRGR